MWLPFFVGEKRGLLLIPFKVGKNTDIKKMGLNLYLEFHTTTCNKGGV